MDDPRTSAHSIGGALPGLQIRFVRTPMEFEAVRAVRRVVFHEEQGLVGPDVMDSDDQRSFHALALLPLPDDIAPEHLPREDHPCMVGNLVAVAVGRLTSPLLPQQDWHISWVATRPAYRRLGIGERLMRVLIREAEHRGANRIALSAQGPAIRFYERLGFHTVGRPWDVRGVLHQRMERETQRA